MTRYLSLAEFWFLAEQITGVDAATLINASRVDLADSALHAPQAGFGVTDFYPDLYDKAAVLACRIAWNHPLPDGNKRAAWACLAMSTASGWSGGHGQSLVAWTAPEGPRESFRWYGPPHGLGRGSEDCRVPGRPEQA